MTPPYSPTELLSACRAFTGAQEGCTLWPILDTTRNATIGWGRMIPSDLAARDLWPDVEVAELDDEWEYLMSGAEGKLPDYYETRTDLRITQAQADEWFDADLQQSIDQCAILRGIRGFLSLPGPCQVAINDINFNVGDVQKFPKMLKAMSMGDWQLAADESNRPQLPARSEATRALILSVLPGATT